MGHLPLNFFCGAPLFRTDPLDQSGVPFTVQNSPRGTLGSCWATAHTDACAEPLLLRDRGTRTRTYTTAWEFLQVSANGTARRRRLYTWHGLACTGTVPQHEKKELVHLVFLVQFSSVAGSPAAMSPSRGCLGLTQTHTHIDTHTDQSSTAPFPVTSVCTSRAPPFDPSLVGLSLAKVKLKGPVSLRCRWRAWLTAGRYKSQ